MEREGFEHSKREDALRVNPSKDLICERFMICEKTRKEHARWLVERTLPQPTKAEVAIVLDVRRLWLTQKVAYVL